MDLGYMLDALSPANFLTALFGTFIGILLGVLPGVGNTLAVSLFIPFTLAMGPETALILLGAIYGGGVFGGSVTSILINVPGSAANAITTIEGNPLARAGRAGFAIGVAAGASFIGAMAGVLSLLFLAPILARLALQFGPREYFMLSLLGIVMIARASPTSTIKGIVSGFLGLLISSVGLSTLTAYPRFTFGSSYLLDGFPLVPTIIGLFGISEVLSMIANPRPSGTPKEGLRDIIGGVLYPLKHVYLLVKSSILGIFIGILPGVGAEVANTVAYLEARRSSRHPERYGHGEPEGLTAAECGNNAAVAATLVPTLTLGIPGSAVAALFAAPLIMHGLRPGRDLFVGGGPIMGVFIGGLFLASIMMLVLGVAGAPLFARVTTVPTQRLLGPVTVLCLLGAYSVRGSFTDMLFICGVGVVGYMLRRTGYSAPALLIGLVLGPIAEEALGQAVLIGGGDPLYIVGGPWSALFASMIVLVLAQPLLARFTGIKKLMGRTRSLVGMSKGV